LPFDYERPASVDLRKSANRSVVGFDVTVAPNSRPAASRSENYAHCQENNRALFHVRYGFSSYDAAAPRSGFRKIFRRAVSKRLSVESDMF
jgi:hypothetical protein